MFTTEKKSIEKKIKGIGRKKLLRNTNKEEHTGIINRIFKLNL